jgi:hypothetical protein
MLFVLHIFKPTKLALKAVKKKFRLSLFYENVLGSGCIAAYILYASATLPLGIESPVHIGYDGGPNVRPGHCR